MNAYIWYASGNGKPKCSSDKGVNNFGHAFLELCNVRLVMIVNVGLERMLAEANTSAKV